MGRPQISFLGRKNTQKGHTEKQKALPKEMEENLFQKKSKVNTKGPNMTMFTISLFIY